MKAGWQAKRLSDVATLQRGFDLPTRNRVSGSFPLVSSSGVIDTHNQAPVKGPGVATGRSGSIGNVFYVEADFWPLNTVLYVKNFHGNYPRFIFHLLRNFDLRRFASGAGVPTLNRNFVHDEIVSVPPPSEQQRIAGILDEAFAGIATAKVRAEQNRQNARALFESHLQSIFTQQDSDHRLCQLGDVCKEITVGHVGPMKTKYKEVGIPFLRSQNIRPFYVDPTKLVFIDAQFHKSLSKSTLRPGDVAIVRTGYPGTAAVIPENMPESNCSDLVIARPGSNIDAHYLAMFFNSEHGKRLVAGQLVGAAQKHFNVGAAKQVAISLPSVAEQKSIVARLNMFRVETQRLESLYTQKLAALVELKKSLLHQAFNGEL